MASEPTSTVDEKSERRGAVTTTGNGVTENKESGDNDIQQKRTVAYSALTSDGLLDVYTYHRGKEGLEARHAETGELLCDVEPTDTNHAVDEPNLMATITLQFPLQDCIEYKTTVSWDLSNPNMPTPAQYAADIARNFGLGFTQTMELADSIQDQLRFFITENCGRYPSLSLLFEPPLDPPVATVPSLYGEVTGDSVGGQSFSLNQRTKPIQRIDVPCILRPLVTDPTKFTGKRKRDHHNNNGSSNDTPPVEQKYVYEVRKRLRQASEEEIREKWAASALLLPLGSISTTTQRCHICQTEGSNSLFACGRQHHAMCSNHLRAILSVLKLDACVDTIPVILPFCPICSLSCRCVPCSNKLQAISSGFATECRKQQTSLEMAKFDHILEYSRTVSSKPDSRKSNRSVGRCGNRVDRRHVSKVPLSDFPREVFGGVDIDPGTWEIYSTTYSHSGNIICHEAASVTDNKVGTAFTMEDGSIDYCMACNKVGSLLCCDLCPRAFHQECLDLGRGLPEPVDKVWECPSCKSEREGLVRNKLDGLKFLDKVIAGFDVVDRCLSSTDLQSLKTLCIIYEMIVVLMEYDFGVMFRTPVDTSSIPSYLDIVKQPMDLGTIASGIINGAYRDRYIGNDDLFSEAVLAVLMNIELVWHNCFLFNSEGSAVYRMAIVQKRRACAIRLQSFDALLRQDTKQRLTEYEDECARQRGLLVRVNGVTNEQHNRQQARHKITATSRGSNGRPIAVLDPESGKIVKMYNTVPAVQSVMELFAKLNHPCEYERFELDSIAKVRRLVIDSAHDARIRVFGYRWIFFDELRKGKISFRMPALQIKGKPSKDDPPVSVHVAANNNTTAEAFEVCMGDLCYLFASLEEALVYANVSEATTVISEKQQLHVGEQFTELFGLKLRRYCVKASRNADALDISNYNDVMAVKVDVVSNRTLVGFRSLDAAFEDWCRTIKGSMMKIEGVVNKDRFESHFLLGSQTLDGLRWSLVVQRASEFQPKKDSKRKNPDLPSLLNQNGRWSSLKMNEEMKVPTQTIEDEKPTAPQAKILAQNHAETPSGSTSNLLSDDVVLTDSHVLTSAEISHTSLLKSGQLVVEAHNMQQSPSHHFLIKAPNTFQC